MKTAALVALPVAFILACSGSVAAAPDAHAPTTAPRTHTPASTRPAANAPAANRPRPQPAQRQGAAPARRTTSTPAPAPAPTPAANPANSAPAHPDNHATPTPATTVAVAAVAHADGPTPDEALALLAEGNQRWVSNHADAPNTDPERRESVATGGQHPFATILTCADSRLPVERLFDRGVGDLFVLRVAGNVLNDELLGTVEYGVGHLHTPVIVVMGHTKCGAVAATVGNANVHGAVARLLTNIQPAADRARAANPGADEATLVDAAIRENVWQTVYELFRDSPEVREHITDGKVRVVGAVADIASGQVEFLGEHPSQSELVMAFNAAHAAAGGTTQGNTPRTAGAPHAEPESTPAPRTAAPRTAPGAPQPAAPARRTTGARPPANDRRTTAPAEKDGH